MKPGLVVLLVAVVVAVAFGLHRRRTDGRFRGQSHDIGPQPLSPAAVLVESAGATLGERATLLQFSSAFCAPCRATRVVLADVAATVPGVVHVEIDAEEHLDDVRALAVLRTPTTLVLDAAGVEVTRASGAPTRAHVVSALAAMSQYMDGEPTS